MTVERTYYPIGLFCQEFGLHTEDVVAALEKKHGSGTNLLLARDVDDILVAARLRERDRLLARVEARIERQKAPCWVYFIGGDVGYIKIGISTQPEVRFKTIQNNSPIPLRVLAMVKGYFEDEQLYHKRFAQYRRHGEWFERAPEILAEIEALATNDNHPLPWEVVA